MTRLHRLRDRKLVQWLLGYRVQGSYAGTTGAPAAAEAMVERTAQLARSAGAS